MVRKMKKLGILVLLLLSLSLIGCINPPPPRQEGVMNRLSNLINRIKDTPGHGATSYSIELEKGDVYSTKGMAHMAHLNDDSINLCVEPLPENLDDAACPSDYILKTGEGDFSHGSTQETLEIRKYVSGKFRAYRIGDSTKIEIWIGFKPD